VSRVLLLGPAREAAGVRSAQIDGDTLSKVMAAAVTRFGQPFAEILAVSRLWVNGEDASPDQPVGPSDEIAVVPPVSGG
jgi:molybdopterin converting factor small subunit